MSEVVFILGAGASKKCGAPLMAEFLDVAADLYKKQLVNNKREHFERVFKAISNLQAVHSKSQLDLTNIESVFNAFEISHVLKKLPGFEPDEIPEVIGSLKELIVETIEQTMLFKYRSRSFLIPQPYGSFVDLLIYLKETAHPSRKSSVITFNYDIALDVAFYLSGVDFHYFVENTNPRHVDTIPYLKLHGSLNWALKTDENIVYPLLFEKYFEEYRISPVHQDGKGRIPIGSQLKKYFEKRDLPIEPEPFIVPPSWNKADQHQSLSSVWAQAAKQLETAEYIFIIGYSLPETDAFFRLLYALGTAGEKTLSKIIVFNPDNSGIVEKRFRSMLGPAAEARFEYLPYTFAQSIHYIQDIFPKKP